MRRCLYYCTAERPCERGEMLCYSGGTHVFDCTLRTLKNALKRNNSQPDPSNIAPAPRQSRM